MRFGGKFNERIKAKTKSHGWYGNDAMVVAVYHVPTLRSENGTKAPPVYSDGALLESPAE